MYRYLMAVFIILTVSHISARPVSLEEAQKAALEKSYGYAIAEENTVYSGLSVKSAFSNFLPAASLSASYMLYTPEVEMSSFKFTPPSTMTPVTMTQKDRTAFGLRVTQPLFTGGRIWYGYQISKDSEKMSTNTLNSEMKKLMAETEAQYLSVLEAEEMYKIAKESLELSKRTEESAKIRFDSGLLSRADVLKSSSLRANSEVSLSGAEKLLALSRINFTRITGIKDFTLEPADYESSRDLLETIGALKYSDLNEKSEILIKKAEENNSDLLNLKLSEKISEKQLSVSKGSFLPSVSLSYTTEWAKTNVTDEFKNNGNIMLSASVPVLPLYDNYIGIEKSRVELKRSKLAYKQIRENVTTLISTHLFNMVSGAKQFNSAKIAVELAEETYYSLEERYNSGLSTEDELNNARISLDQARYNRTAVFYSILKSRSELVKITGIDAEIINGIFE